MFAAAAASAAAAQSQDASRHSRYIVDKAIADLLTDTESSIRQQGDGQPIYLLFVHVRTLQLAPEHADTRFQIRIRYGGNGHFAERFSPKQKSSPKGPEQFVIQTGAVVQIKGLTNSPELNGAVGVCEGWDSSRDRWNVRVTDADVKSVRVQNLVPAADVIAMFDDVQMFRWNPQLAPYITIAIRKLGFVDSTISQEAIQIPFDERRWGAAEQELIMFKQAGKFSFEKAIKKAIDPEGWKRTHPLDGVFVGQLGLGIELKKFTVGELRRVALGAEYFHQMVGALELLSLADELGSTTVIHTVPHDFLEHRHSFNFPASSTASRSPRSQDPRRESARTSAARQAQDSGCTTGGTPGSANIQMGRPVNCSMAGSSSDPPRQTSSHGVSPNVIGRPMPGAGWFWRGQRLKED